MNWLQVWQSQCVIHIDTLKTCYYCGYKHQPRNCLAYGKKSFKCNGLNHLASTCRWSLKPPRRMHNVKEVEDYDERWKVKRYQSFKIRNRKRKWMWQTTKFWQQYWYHQTMIVMENRIRRQHFKWLHVM